MPNKNILVSDDTNDTGRYTQIQSIITDGQLSSSIIIINTSSYNISTNSLLQMKDGKIEGITGSAAQDNYGVFFDEASSKFILKENTIGKMLGDLTGSYNNVKVKNISNVTSGTLSVLYGGTGTSSFTQGSLLTTSGSGLNYTGNANKSVAVGADGSFIFVSNISNITKMTGSVINLYTGSVGITTTQIWNKPPGCRFIRVICLGGGASGRTARGGYGGGGGGYSDVMFNANLIPSTVLVTAGSGGLGGTSVSNNGGSSSFGQFIYAGGGSNLASNAAAGGFGYTENGGNGGLSGGTNQAGASGADTKWAGPGGGGGGSRVSSSNNGGGNGGAVTKNLGNGGLGGTGTVQAGLNGVLGKKMLLTAVINNGGLQSIPSLISGGGGGGGASYSNAGIGGSGLFGAGGGAGGVAETNFAGAAGNGGPGYVLIICY